MKKQITWYCLVILLIFLNLSNSLAQKDTWKLFFPGYNAEKHYAFIDVDKNLNMVLTNSVAGQPAKFVTLDPSGYVTFNENTTEIALLHFKDSSMNRYLVSYATPILRIRKYNNQGTLIYNKSNSISNAVTIGGPLPDYRFIMSCNQLISSNGKLVISGLFRTDTVVPASYETLNLFFVDTANGEITNQYVKTQLENIVVETLLQEDDLGNINVFHYNEVQNEAYLKKVSITGNLLLSREYGDDLMGTSVKKALKFTENFIYLLIHDFNNDISLMKLNKTTFDTIYYVNTLLPDFTIGDYWEASDTAFYMSYDNGLYGAFRIYDDAGNITCQDNSGNFLNYGYKFVLNGNKCYSARGTFSQRDTACIFTVCSPTVDPNTQQLIYGRIGFYSYPDENYSAEGITYIVSKNTANIPGVIGLIDAKQNNFSGLLYHDINLNCVADSAEPGIPNQLVQIDPSGKFVFTDQNGFFQNYLDSGSYTLSAIPFNYTLSQCPNSISLNIIDTLQLNSGNDIGIQDQIGNLQDLAITINQTPAVPGITSYIYITVRNMLPLPATGVIAVTIDTSLFSFNYTSISVDSTSGNNYFWHVNNLNFLSHQIFTIGFSVDTQAVAGTPFTTTASITNISGESNITNNVDLFEGEVLSSFDPNDKHVVPRGYGTSGTISPLDTVLNYKIRFQNTGTYMAFKVYVIDTIDSFMDIASFQLQSTSHDCQLTFLDTNVIQFMFEDIMLPHSGANVALSNGFINYRINLKSGLPITTEIKNKAHIYFDYNEPIVTNEVINTIGVLSLEEVATNPRMIIFPNPTTDELNVNLSQSETIVRVTIIDLSGREIRKLKPNNENYRASISVRDIPSGFYFVRTETKKHVIVKSFIKL